jgi:hypothetical protein
LDFEKIKYVYHEKYSKKNSSVRVDAPPELFMFGFGYGIIQ